MNRNSVFPVENLLLFVVLEKTLTNLSKTVIRSSTHAQCALPSFLLGESGIGLILGAMKRLKPDTRSRNDNAGLGGATGRWGNVFKI